MNILISVIIPNFNGSTTIGTCLEAVFSSDYQPYEVVVVDDCSTDNSVDIIQKYPCKLIQLTKQGGASRARNIGAQNSTGDVLFFTDADCILRQDTLAVAAEVIAGNEAAIIGGTYTAVPADPSFFSTVQSIFIHYSETKRAVPDYIATHAMVIRGDLFRKSGGFPEDFLPILEDVEFSHRLRRSGVTLIMDPRIQVRHVFNFTLRRSLMNAFRKSFYWTVYSLKNRDLFKDSGTASLELKVNVISFFISLPALLLSFLINCPPLCYIALTITISNLVINRGLISAFSRTRGIPFALAAASYYAFVYPVAVGAGSLAGIVKHLLSVPLPETERAG